MQASCQRCGDYADLQAMGGLSLCATCLSRGDDPRVTGLRVRTVFVETVRLSLRLWRVALWLTPVLIAESLVELLATTAAHHTGFSSVAGEWAKLPLEALAVGVLVAAASDYIETGKLPRLSQALASALRVWPTLLALLVFCQGPLLVTNVLASAGPGGVAESSSGPASALSAILNIGFLFYAVPMVIVERMPLARALVLAPSLLRRSLKPFAVCAFLFGALSQLFRVSDTTLFVIALETPQRLTTFLIIANALLAPFAFPHIVLRSLLFAKLRRSDAEVAREWA